MIRTYLLLSCCWLIVTGCAAIGQPQIARLPRSATLIPLRIAICPAAEAAQAWMTRESLFAHIELERDRQAGDPAPDLVVTKASSQFKPTLNPKPTPLSTRVTEVLSIISLGVLPTYYNHRGDAQVNFHRPTPGAAPCGQGAPDTTA